MPGDSGGPTAPIHLWSLREDVLVEDGPEPGRLVVVTTWDEFVIDRANDTIVESLRRMSLGPISLENVAAGGRSADGRGDPADRPPEWVELRQVLDLLSGSVVRSLRLRDADRPLLSAVPLAQYASLRLPEIGLDQPLRLSRFAALRYRRDDLLVESPLGRYQVVLHQPPAAHVVTALAQPSSVRAIAAELDVEPVVVAAIAAYLVGVGIALVGEPGEPVFTEDDDPVLDRWSHHDLMFHARSRMGRYDGQPAEQPAAEQSIPDAGSGARVALYRPDTAALAATDPTLSQVLDNAKLCADLTDQRLGLDRVGELLFRTARIRAVTSGAMGTNAHATDRTYLSVHGMYELELYVSAHNCADLPRGSYHYDPGDHTLTLVNGSETELDELLEGARLAAKSSVRPPLLITITARVTRKTWLYRGVGYSLVLTHVGALQQAMCLVANAMGLAACVPVIDPGDITNSALRLNWPAEVGIGEFLVG